MANFVGVVTQQDVQTGITLRARVTSPKEHYTGYQDFKCMVKKAGLTDEQAVMTDLNTISNKLLANGVTGITSNLTSYMPSTGDNETNVTYTVSGEIINKYFNSDGIVIKRPPYGANSVVGSLIITVTKNAAVAERNITISIEPYTAQDLVQAALNLITWDNIRGMNASESTDPSSNGMYNVIHPLKLMNEITTELVEKPVKVKWEIIQDILSPMLDGDYRVSTLSGIVTRPTYRDIYKAKDTIISSTMLDTVTSKIEYAYGKTYYRIGGLTLKASIEIEDIDITAISNSVTFNLKTLSAALTNKEVADYLTDNISVFSIKDTKYSSVFSLSTINDTSERTLFFDGTGANASVIELYQPSTIETATASNDFTHNGIKVTSAAWSTINPDTVDTAPENMPSTEYSALGIQENKLIVLNPSVTPSKNKLVFRCVISIHGYDNNVSSITVYYRFILNDLTTVIPPAGSGGATGGTSGTGSTT